MNRAQQTGKKVLVVGASLLLFNCATPMMNTNDPDPSMVRLTQLAEDTQKSWMDIEAMESSKYAKEHGSLNTISHAQIPSMQKMVSLGDDWNGPIAPLIRALCTLSGWEYRENGVEPAGGVIVSVDTSYVRIIDILKNAGHQAGSRANINLLAKERVIEINYAGL